MAIKFNKHNVTNTATKIKARVYYSNGVHAATGRKSVTLYAKDYSRDLGRVFPSKYVNGTDSMSDYFDEGRVTFFEGEEHYPAAKERADQREAEFAAKRAR